jgi:hypothetical protein
MPGTFHPREAVKALLRGERPARPLFLPILFSLGARVENMPLQVFLGSATKIANSLRQMQAHLHADAITCYFDPFVEAESLGGEVRWDSHDSAAELHWPETAGPGAPPDAWGAPEGAATRGRVPVAVDVIRRLKSLVRDGTLLMVGVTGPFALSALLAGTNGTQAAGLSSLHANAVEISGAVVAAIVRAYLEAGADVILVHERAYPSAVPGEVVEEGLVQLATTANIVRFYEALPVLLFTGATGETAREAARRGWEAMWCTEFPVCGSADSATEAGGSTGPWGVAIPAEALAADDAPFAEFEERWQRMIQEARPAVVTTACDVSETAHMQRLARLAAPLVRTA